MVLAMNRIAEAVKTRFFGAPGFLPEALVLIAHCNPF
jgi:hypothetical protein